VLYRTILKESLSNYQQDYQYKNEGRKADGTED